MDSKPSFTLKHASLYLVPAGHWLQIDEPEQVATEMLS
jgi:pimeloyl-ACP methyl ester carboxylesterase